MRSPSENDPNSHLDTHESVYREQLLEHLLVAELLKHAWLNEGANLEVSKPEIDRAGYDLLLEANGIIRHVQLKTSAHSARTKVQKIHVNLLEKPSGCVIWTIFDPGTLELGPFLFFGATPGTPLPSISDFRIAKHTKGNAKGEKTLRVNIRVVPRGKFAVIPTIRELYSQLFGS